MSATRCAEIVAGVVMNVILADPATFAPALAGASVVAAPLANIGDFSIGTAASTVQSPGLFNILSFATAGQTVDATGARDVSPALSGAIAAANALTAKGQPACVYVPAGKYRIAASVPEFALAGCIEGDGSSLSQIILDETFSGDLFSWSEAWLPTMPGPRVVGLKITADAQTAHLQNALVFYDRDDNVFLDDVEVNGVYGRAFYSGATQNAPQAYMRESHFRSLRFYNDGAPGTPVAEFNSVGGTGADATDEIDVDQLDIYGARGPSLIIRNQSAGSVRDLKFRGLRIEGTENGTAAGDLITIGDPLMTGSVNNIQFNEAELIDSYTGYAAIRMTAASAVSAPYQITFNGLIGGGLPNGQGIHIDAGRSSIFQITAMYTNDTNVVVGSNVTSISFLGGDVLSWTRSVDVSSTVTFNNW